MVYPELHSTRNRKGRFVKHGVNSRLKNAHEKRRAVAEKNKLSQESAKEEVEKCHIPSVNGLVIIDLEHLSQVGDLFLKLITIQLIHLV